MADGNAALIAFISVLAGGDAGAAEDNGSRHRASGYLA